MHDFLVLFLKKSSPSLSNARWPKLLVSFNCGTGASVNMCFFIFVPPKSVTLALERAVAEALGEF
jgi:hypothetical protein